MGCLAFVVLILMAAAWYGGVAGFGFAAMFLVVVMLIAAESW